MLKMYGVLADEEGRTMAIPAEDVDEVVAEGHWYLRGWKPIVDDLKGAIEAVEAGFGVTAAGPEGVFARRVYLAPGTPAEELRMQAKEFRRILDDWRGPLTWSAHEREIDE